MNTVYKYCDQYGVSILRNLELKITPPNGFNDPFEFTPHWICSDPRAKALSLINVPEETTFLEDKFQKETAAGTFTGTFKEFVGNFVEFHLSPAIPPTMEKLKRDTLKRISENFGILCLSKGRRSIVMWGHYGDKHRGLVIGLDGSHALFQKGAGLRPVDYVKARAVVDTCWNEGGVEETKGWDVVAFSKNEEWRYEGELRQIFNLGDLAKRWVRSNRTGKKLRAYFHPLPPEAIVRVSLGVWCPPRLQHRVELALQNPRLAHVSLDRARLHDNQFDLTFEMGRCTNRPVRRKLLLPLRG